MSSLLFIPRVNTSQPSMAKLFFNWILSRQIRRE